jgi:RHS repeat-associated protein
VYDRLGREVTSTDETGVVTQRSYDIFDQALTITLPEHAVAAPRIRSYTYDAYGKVLSEGGAGGYPIAYTYDLAGNRLSLTAQYGINGISQTTNWLYDVRNREQKKTYPDSSYHQYVYDEVGNIKTRRDGMGRLTNFTYNNYNQPLVVDYQSDVDVTFTYDSAGRHIGMVDGSRDGGASCEWAYDTAGRVILYTQHAVDRKIAYTYNVESGRTSMSVDRISAPGSPWITAYAYDNFGRLQTLQDSRVSATPFTYTWSPQVRLPAEILMPSGAKQVKSYDALARLTEIKALNGVGAVVNRYAYTYNVAGQRQDVTMLDGGKISYAYDSARQLAGVTKNNDASYVYNYAYDEIGNWLSGVTGRAGMPPLAKTFTPNSLNQYEQVGAISQAYDLNGNLTNDGSRVYTYDEENRLRTVGGSLFGYDGFGRRVQADGTRYLYDEWNVIAELDSSNEITRSVTRGLDVLGAFSGASRPGSILATVTSGNVGYYFYDGNGNVTMVLDGANISLANYTYDPFGNKVAESGVYSAQPYQWSTKEFHASTKLVYYGYRYYDPSIGRWLNRDLIGEKGGVNIYSFVKNSPVILWDELGLDYSRSIDVGGAFYVPGIFVGGSGRMKIQVNMRDCCDSSGRVIENGDAELKIRIRITAGIGVGGAVNIGSASLSLAFALDIAAFEVNGEARSPACGQPIAHLTLQGSQRFGITHSYSVGVGVVSAMVEVRADAGIKLRSTVGEYAATYDLSFTGRVGVYGYTQLLFRPPSVFINEQKEGDYSLLSGMASWRG